MKSVVARLFLIIAIALAGSGASFAADPAPIDYSKPPVWWPKGVKYANPPQKKAPKGWKGAWPPKKERGHEFSFWTEYFKLKPSGPKKFGKPGDPDAPFADGFAGNAKFVSGFPAFNRQRLCKPFRFAAKSKPAFSKGICAAGIMYPSNDIAKLCSQVAGAKSIDRFCANQCKRKQPVVGIAEQCRGSVVRPPASWLWSCVDKEAAALISCEVQFICDCKG